MVHPLYLKSDLGHNAFGMESLTCINVNECILDLDDCSDKALCMDSSGTIEGYTCECFDGFLDDDANNAGRTCTDIDECSDGSNDCNENATCTNTSGGFTCFCNSGYTGDGRTCDDIDECGDKVDECDALGICTNEVGGYTCECPEGYAGDGYSCVGMNIRIYKIFKRIWYG